MIQFEQQVIAEYPAEDFFSDADSRETDNWRYCCNRAPFQHQDACEFMLYLYKDETDEFFEAEEVKRMKNANCSKEFIDVVLDARKQGFSWLLLYA